MTYPSLEAFYAGDDRRPRSRELDIGLWWRGRAGATFRAAWVEQTGELYLFEHVRPGLRGGVHVLPRRFTEDELEHAFAGWRHVCGRPRSIDWLTARAAPHTPRATPRRPAARGGRGPARRRPSRTLVPVG